MNKKEYLSKFTSYCENNTGYKERCKDCAYLVEKDNSWYCDEQSQYCKNIEYCHSV